MICIVRYRSVYLFWGFALRFVCFVSVAQFGGAFPANVCSFFTWFWTVLLEYGMLFGAFAANDFEERSGIDVGDAIFV